MKYIVIIAGLILLSSCNSNSKTGIAGNHNNNNTVIIADKIEYPDEEKRKYKENLDITPQGVGGILIGQTVEEVQSFYKKNKNYKFKIDEGARGAPTDYNFSTIYVEDLDEKPLLGLISYNLKVVDEIEVYSEKYKTYNGIHVGMTVRELSKIYLNNLILEDNVIDEKEYFSPFDLNGTSTYTLICVRSDDGGSLMIGGFSIDSVGSHKEHNYKMSGRISEIIVARRNI